MLIFIPNFEDSCQIDLNFLVSTFGGENIEGTFKISEISEGISFERNQFDIKLISNENYFSIKLKVDLTNFNDNEIALFEFKINNITKKILLLQNCYEIGKLNINLIKKIENNEEKQIQNLNEIKKDSILISPFSLWAKGTFLFRQCYFNGKKNLEIEIDNNLNLYYLTNDGYITKEKKNNYLIRKLYFKIKFPGYHYKKYK